MLEPHNICFFLLSYWTLALIVVLNATTSIFPLWTNFFLTYVHWEGEEELYRKCKVKLTNCCESNLKSYEILVIIWEWVTILNKISKSVLTELIFLV